MSNPLIHISPSLKASSLVWCVIKSRISSILNTFFFKKALNLSFSNRQQKAYRNLSCGILWLTLNTLPVHAENKHLSLGKADYLTRGLFVVYYTRESPPRSYTSWLLQSLFWILRRKSHCYSSIYLQKSFLSWITFRQGEGWNSFSFTHCSTKSSWKQLNTGANVV